MQDLTQAAYVEVRIEKHGGTFRLWVNVDGRCELRAYNVEKVIFQSGELTATLQD